MGRPHAAVGRVALQAQRPAAPGTFLRTLASDPDLSEAMGNAMQVMMQGPLLAEAQRRKGMLSQISSLEHELQHKQ